MKTDTVQNSLRLEALSRDLMDLGKSVVNLTKSEVKLVKTEGELYLGNIINRILIKLVSLCFIVTGIIFLSIAIVFFLNEYFSLNYSIGCGVVALLLSGVGLLLFREKNVNKNLPTGKDHVL